MAPSSSPTVRRRRLAAELRRLRQASKLTIEQVAETLEWSPGKVSKIENARVSVLPRDTRKLLDTYGVTEGQERDLLLSLARESRARGWWQQYGDTVPEWFATYVGLEAEAAGAPNITLQILPFSAGAHASMDSAFWILSFDPPTDSEVVYFEHPTCSLYLEKPDEVARYRLVYEHLRAASLSLDDSRRLIARSAEDLA